MAEEKVVSNEEEQSSLTEKKEEQAQAEQTKDSDESSTPDVKTDVTPESEETAEVDDTQVPKIPRERLNEEIEKRHQLEEQMKFYKQQAETMQTQQQQVPQLTRQQALDQLRKQYGLDERDLEGNPKYDDKMIDAMVGISSAMANAQTQRLSTKMNDYQLEIQKMSFRNNPLYKKYEKEVEARLAKATPESKADPLIVSRVFREVVGNKAITGEYQKDVRQEVIKEMDGKKKVITKKRVEESSGVNFGPTEAQLTENQKKLVDAGLMSEKEAKSFTENLKVQIDDTEKNTPKFGGK